VLLCRTVFYALKEELLFPRQAISGKSTTQKHEGDTDMKCWENLNTDRPAHPSPGCFGRTFIKLARRIPDIGFESRAHPAFRPRSTVCAMGRNHKYALTGPRLRLAQKLGFLHSCDALNMTDDALRKIELIGKSPCPRIPHRPSPFSASSILV
jgi:hypothetical protein